MKIHFYKTEDKVILKARKKISTLLSDYHKKGIPVLFLLSGGSALKLLDGINTSFLGPNITIGVLDERYSTNPIINNFAQVMETNLYKEAKKAKCLFIDTRILLGEKQDELRTRFEKSLKEWKRANLIGKIIITQGIGPDGHTSGILPFPEDPTGFINKFRDPNVWVQAYDAVGKNQYALRVTTTLSFLKLVDISIVFVCGPDKIDALKNALEPSSQDKEAALAKTPARIINEMKEVFIFTDISISK